MGLFHLLSTMLSFACMTFASIATPGHLSVATTHVDVAQKAALVIKDFLISDIRTYSVIDSTNTSSPAAPNTTIHFTFADPNSNTSTTCTDSWVTANVTGTAPYNTYVICDSTNITEYFQWEFITYSGPDDFQIMFAHMFSDPVNYPPPFDVVEYFSAPTNFTLTCSNATRLSACSMPDHFGPTQAMIDGISN